ncbi:MAG: hypothetical protein ACK5O9_04660 [Holosporales bacterium]
MTNSQTPLVQAQEKLTTKQFAETIGLMVGATKDHLQVYFTNVFKDESFPGASAIVENFYQAYDTLNTALANLDPEFADRVAAYKEWWEAEFAYDAYPVSSRGSPADEALYRTGIFAGLQALSRQFSKELKDSDPVLADAYAAFALQLQVIQDDFAQLYRGYLPSQSIHRQAAQKQLDAVLPILKQEDPRFSDGKMPVWFMNQKLQELQKTKLYYLFGRVMRGVDTVMNRLDEASAPEDHELARAVHHATKSIEQKYDPEQKKILEDSLVDALKSVALNVSGALEVLRLAAAQAALRTPFLPQKSHISAFKNGTGAVTKIFASLAATLAGGTLLLHSGRYFTNLAGIEIRPSANAPHIAETHQGASPPVANFSEMEQLTLAAYAAFHVNVEYLEQKGLTPVVEAEGRNTNAVGMVPTIENFLKENPAFQALNDDQRNGLANDIAGLQMVAFHDTNNDRIVIGVPGFEADSILDGLKDLPEGKKVWSDEISTQVIPALLYAQAIKDYYGKDVVMSGQSLGAQVAQAWAAIYGGKGFYIESTGQSDTFFENLSKALAEHPYFKLRADLGELTPERLKENLKKNTLGEIVFGLNRFNAGDRAHDKLWMVLSEGAAKLSNENLDLFLAAEGGFLTKGQHRGDYTVPPALEEGLGQDNVFRVGRFPSDHNGVTQGLYTDLTQLRSPEGSETTMVRDWLLGSANLPQDPSGLTPAVALSRVDSQGKVTTPVTLPQVRDVDAGLPLAAGELGAGAGLAVLGVLGLKQSLKRE